VLQIFRTELVNADSSGLRLSRIQNLTNPGTI
jgi:hypothetical protein